MINSFDRIVLAVPDLADAVAYCRQLLGVEPVYSTGPGGRPTAWAGLPNTVIEMVQVSADQAAISGIVLEDPLSGVMDAPLPNIRSLDLALCDGSATREFRRLHPAAQTDDMRVDHLVLRTGNADDCIELFANQLGIRVALDKAVPQWGGRMVFLRTGKLTLEIIQSDREPPAEDYFWGIAYQCSNLEKMALQLRERGVELSAIREGRKPGTRVATLKSHCLGLPSLLIEPAYSPLLSETL